MALYVIEGQHPLDRICFPNGLLPVATYIAQPRRRQPSKSPSFAAALVRTVDIGAWFSEPKELIMRRGDGQIRCPRRVMSGRSLGAPEFWCCQQTRYCQPFPHAA